MTKTDHHNRNISQSLSVLLIILALSLSACASSSSSTANPTTSPPPVASAITRSSTTPSDPYVEKRERMVETTILSRGVSNPDVLAAMRNVPRHEFVPEEYQDQAYADHPLPIGYGQTISQPYIVAWMTELLELKPGERVLEIGTGSGYQAAVLAYLGYAEVYTIEIVPELAVSARDVLRRLGYSDIGLLEGDGYYGWPEHAPFDAIIVTAAPDHLPAPLAEQLAEGGRLVIPIGPPGGYQSLWKFINESGELKAYNLGGVAFVPFTGEGVKNPTAVPLP